MAARTLTYLDIPPNRRQAMAVKHHAKLLERLADPSNTPRQAQELEQQLTRINQWANGVLPVPTSEN
jgi:hypothetical protein